MLPATLSLKNLLVMRHDRGWILRQPDGGHYRLDPFSGVQWVLYAVSGGRAVHLTGRLDEDGYFVPITVSAPSGTVTLTRLPLVGRKPRRPWPPVQWDTAPSAAARPTPLPAPVETQPYVSPAAQAYLRRILDDEHKPALVEWVVIAVDREEIARPELVPHLLYMGTKRPYLRPVIAAVVGQRGRWLAREVRNQAWGWLLAPLPSLAAWWAERHLNEDQAREALIANDFRTYFALGMCRRFPHPWRAELSMLLVESVKRSATPSRYGVHVNDIYPYEYLITLEQLTEIVKLHSHKIYVQERIKYVGLFRESLHEAFTTTPPDNP